jgi:hypothetical protein
VNCRSIAEKVLKVELATAGELGIRGDCEACDRPKEHHVILSKGELEKLRETDLIVTYCAPIYGVDSAVWVMEREAEDPCDEDFMGEISI